MSALKYVGRVPSTDYSLANKKYADGRYNTVRVDPTYIAGQVGLVTGNLATKDYVDQQDALRAKKIDAANADSLYLHNDRRDAANGVAPLNGTTQIPAFNIPSTISLNRKPIVVPADQILMTGNQDLTTPSAKGFRAATLTIADPGYPYIPLCFATVQGGALLAPQNVTRQYGTPNFGQLSVLSPDNTRWAWCLCTGVKTLAHYTTVPVGDQNINPTTRPPVEGNLTLELWLGLQTGTTYSFRTTNLSFYAIVMPGA